MIEYCKKELSKEYQLFQVIILNIFAVFFAYLAKFRFRHGLKISFILIFIFLALRYNFGSDYQNYYNGFININKYYSINYFDDSIQFEVGWIFLCRVFGPLGFFSMIIFLAAFNCLVYYYFINKYVPVKYYWLAVFIYVFNSEYMLIHASAMRQSVAIAIFLISIQYIYKKDIVRYLICIGIAWLFHSSALILLPIFFIGLWNFEIDKKTAIIIFLVFISLFIYTTTFLPAINEVVSLYFEKYEGYQEQAELSTGFGLIILSCLFIFILYYSELQNKQRTILFKVVLISFLLLPISQSIMYLARVNMYFSPATIAVFPLVLTKIKKPLVQILFTSFLIIFTIYGFVSFFDSEIYKSSVETYQTIFSAPEFNNY